MSKNQALHKFKMSLTKGTIYNLAHKYLREEYGYEYVDSLFSMKPILMSSEIDDSRPTVVKVYSEYPRCAGVLSGKINTVYDLDEVLDYEK